MWRKVSRRFPVRDRSPRSGTTGKTQVDLGQGPSDRTPVSSVVAGAVFGGAGGMWSEPMSVVQVTYFSDVLCIWAYVAQARVDAVRDAFGPDVKVVHRFCSVFGDARNKIATGWHDRGEFAGYNKHVRAVAARFPHVRTDPEVWIRPQPASSASPHLFLSAVFDWQHARLSGAAGGDAIFESVMWAFRRGFFEDGLDIADWDVQCRLAQPFGVDIKAIEDS